MTTDDSKAALSYPSPGESSGFDAEVAALAAALRVTTHSRADEDDAAAILAALDGWTLVPSGPGLADDDGLLGGLTAEIARLRTALEAHHDFNHPNYLCTACAALAPAPSEPD
jgi:hypothetical protein